MESPTKTIPDVLIYEMDEGEPIYYRGYKRYLRGEAELDELMGSSYLQSKIATALIVLLSKKLDPEIFTMLANELGLQCSARSWRAADVAVFRKAALQEAPLNNKYLRIPPETVLEIDTKADLASAQYPYGYFHRKTEQLLEHGTQRVIWIFTETQKIMIATPDADWRITGWNSDVEVVEGVSVNLGDIVQA